MDGFGGANLPTLPMAGMGMGLINPEMAMLMNQEALAMGLGPADLNMAGMMGAGLGMAPMGGPIAAPMAQPPPPPMPPKYDAPVPGKPIFWKTRICQKWLEGRCHYSDEQCNYAHGKHQLRHVAPELIKQAEQAKQAGEGAQQQQQQQQQQQGREAGGSGSTTAGSGPGDRAHPPPLSQPPPPKQQGGGGINMDLWKTKPCFEFMQTGQCHMGAKCKYAHGPEELRQPPGGMGGGGTAAGGGMGPKQPFVQEGSGGMPAGPMFKPPPPASPPPPGMAGPRPPPPAGPPPPGPGMPPAPMRSVHMRPPPPELGMQQQQQQQQQWRPEEMQRMHMHPADQPMRMHPGEPPMHMREPEGEEPYLEGGPGGSSLRVSPPSDVPLVERVRAMCALLGVGEALGKPDPAAVQAAMMATRSGVAFQETAYADSIETFIHHSAAPEPSFGEWR